MDSVIEDIAWILFGTFSLTSFFLALFLFRMKRYRWFSVVHGITLLWWSILLLGDKMTPWLATTQHLCLIAFVYVLHRALNIHGKKLIPRLCPAVCITTGVALIPSMMLFWPDHTEMTGRPYTDIMILMDTNVSLLLIIHVMEVMLFTFTILRTLVFLLDSVSKPVKSHGWRWGVSIVLGAMHVWFALRMAGLFFTVDASFVTAFSLLLLIEVGLMMNDPAVFLNLITVPKGLNQTDGMVTITDREGQVIYVSPVLKQRLSYDGKTSQLSSLLKQASNSFAIVSPEMSVEFFDKEKTYVRRHDSEMALPVSKQTIRWVTFRDITERMRIYHEKDYVMNHDLMTGLHNRNYFENMRADIERDHDTYALILMDLDALKTFNDVLGHKAGDRLIKRFASAIVHISHKYGDSLPIRLGGDEFLLLAFEKSMQEIKHMIDDLTQLCHADDIENNIAFSYGVEHKDVHMEKSLSSLLGMADEHLYVMKKKHKEEKARLRNHLVGKHAKPSAPVEDTHGPDPTPSDG